MIHKIDIDRLRDTYRNWQVLFIQEENYIKITGNLKSDTNELFELLNKVCAANDQNVEINISINDVIEATIENRTAKVKYNKMYTSGCFDIFHYGHLNILERSKAMCNYLVVGVSTDELIEKEKGRLPVIPFEERVKIIKAIKYVDQVIPQVDKNKQRVVDEHNIDAISVGDDWLGRFPKTSCNVEYFSYTKSVSSTILKDILNLNLEKR